MPDILAVEVGNSRAKFGVFRPGQHPSPVVSALTAVPLTESSNLQAALQSWVTEGGFKVDRAIVAGSNPPVRDMLLASWPAEISRPSLVESAKDLPVRLDIERPETVGIDRLLTAFAAIRLFAPGQSVVVVDSGTATTISLVTSDCVFRGGAILPGLRLSARALHEYTARLPLLDTDQIADRVTEAVAPVPGRNTTDAMIAGLFWGQLGAIREIRQRLDTAARQKFAETGNVQCLVTGGGGRQLADHLAPCRYVDSLALHGLALLAMDERRK